MLAAVCCRPFVLVVVVVVGNWVVARVAVDLASVFVGVVAVCIPVVVVLVADEAALIKAQAAHCFVIILLLSWVALFI